MPSNPALANRLREHAGHADKHEGGLVWLKPDEARAAADALDAAHAGPTPIDIERAVLESFSDAGQPIVASLVCATCKRLSALWSPLPPAPEPPPEAAALNRLQDERAADFEKWFKIIGYGGLTPYQAECPIVIDEALRELVRWRWLVSMRCMVGENSIVGRPKWAVLDVDGEIQWEADSPAEAIKGFYEFMELNKPSPAPQAAPAAPPEPAPSVREETLAWPTEAGLWERHGKPYLVTRSPGTSTDAKSFRVHCVGLDDTLWFGDRDNYEYFSGWRRVTPAAADASELQRLEDECGTLANALTAAEAGCSRLSKLADAQSAEIGEYLKMVEAEMSARDAAEAQVKERDERLAEIFAALGMEPRGRDVSEIVDEIRERKSQYEFVAKVAGKANIANAILHARWNNLLAVINWEIAHFGDVHGGTRYQKPFEFVRQQMAALSTPAPDAPPEPERRSSFDGE